AKTLYDGLIAIDRDHPDLLPTQPDQATDDLVRTKSGLLFEQASVDAILGLLDGTSVYTTNAPVGLKITVPDALTKKLAYETVKGSGPADAVVRVTGILTDAEVIAAKALS